MDFKVLSSGVRFQNLPENYVRPENDRPRLSEVSACESLPIIDQGSKDRTRTVRQVGDSCKDYGYFQVVNHGLAAEEVERMIRVGKEFFELPVEEKLKLYSDDPSKTVRLSTSFRLHCHPLQNDLPHWPSNPPSFREVVSDYCVKVRELGCSIAELISEDLGLEKEHVKEVLGEQGQHMAVNYYPPCPEPELTYGLPGHTDPNALTILLQDLQVAGLQVLRNDRWVAVHPHPNAFVVNIGDQLQALSNGVYKSVWHRAVLNAQKPRLSVASFLCPCNDALISPPNADASAASAAVYRGFNYAECYKKFWSRNLDQDHCFERFKYNQ